MQEVAPDSHLVDGQHFYLLSGSCVTRGTGPFLDSCPQRMTYFHGNVFSLTQAVTHIQRSLALHAPTRSAHCASRFPAQVTPSSLNTTTYRLTLWRQSKTNMEARSVFLATLAVTGRSSCGVRPFTTSPGCWVGTRVFVCVCVPCCYEPSRSYLKLYKLKSVNYHGIDVCVSARGWVCSHSSGWADQSQRYRSHPPLCAPSGPAQRQHAVL